MSAFTKKPGVGLKKDKLTPRDFNFGKYLGEGGYGKVYHAQKISGKDKGTVCAMKVMRKVEILKSKKKLQNVRTERNILEVLKHPFIVNLMYAFETEDSFYLGLEYMHGDLFSYLEKVYFLPEDRARLYVAEVILAIKYLHENGIVYRDLKPDNILLDAIGHIRLSDFGLSKRMCPDKKGAHTFCGTLDYMAPEMIQKLTYNGAVDWWSVGVLLFDMLIGSPPFTILNDRNMTMQNIRFGKFSFQSNNVQLSLESKDLICKLLKVQPTQRLGSGPSKAKELMQHPFFKNINWDNLLARKYEPLIAVEEFVSDELKLGDAFRHPFDSTGLRDSDKKIFEDFDYAPPN